MVWHFDYYLRSNVLYQSNNAQTDANRPQMDPMEFDHNDNTQELQLNMSRGNAEDLLYSRRHRHHVSGTRLLPPGADRRVRPARRRRTIAFSGVVPPTQTCRQPVHGRGQPEQHVDDGRGARARVTARCSCSRTASRSARPSTAASWAPRR